MKRINIMTIQKIHRFFLSISLAVTGIFLIIGCLMIYRFGAGTYSREAVADIFSAFAFPICLSPILAVIGWVLDCFFPYADKKQKNKADTAFLLARAYGKKDTDAVSGEILAERKKRKLHTIVLAIVLALTSIVFLIYACNGSNFDRAEINASMIRAMWVLLPCLAVSFVCGVFVLYCREKSLYRELELVRKLPDAEKQTEIVTKTDKNVTAVRIILIAAAIVLLGIGLFTGGAADVLTKAINICTECIGLG
ncbi:MAG: hypothetical protein IJB88_05975 [Clostridia bacterium]|nr:hypothetical protein [Clostridia bacterium]